jgi:hypothetical protein
MLMMPTWPAIATGCLGAVPDRRRQGTASEPAANTAHGPTIRGLEAMATARLRTLAFEHEPYLRAYARRQT